MRLVRAGVLVLLAVSSTGAAQAGPIEQACLASQRAGGDAGLCGCVQQVADITLTGADQRLVAKFFADPNKAETYRMKTSTSSNAFWDRYVIFGQQAEIACQAG